MWVWLPDEREYVRYDLAGNEIERSVDYQATVPGSHRCTQPDQQVQLALIDEREYEVNCGLFSPNGTHMLYGVDVDGAGVPAGRYEAWMLTLDSGERTLVTDALRHCGGCGGRVGPAWSPSGRYVLVGETYSGMDSAMYLHDVETHQTRKVAEGSYVSGMTMQVRWSPTADSVLAPASSGVITLDHLPDRQVVEFPDIGWPARFDETGRLVYAPGGVYTVPADTVRSATTIADAGTGEVLATWEGAPSTWPIERGIAWTAEGPAGLLEQAPDCEGTLLRHPQLAEPRCLPAAAGAAFDPAVERVAYARATAGQDAATRWEIVLFDIATGDERVLATDATGWQPPLIRWQPDGTHLLVLWPGPEGI
ncbi:MAG: hypothetical protein O2888_00895 [Chloroflexi bacterium]|nr:hypothetical protein [Chloroflexota bacterium]